MAKNPLQGINIYLQWQTKYILHILYLAKVKEKSITFNIPLGSQNNWNL
jgi:hypothetical protein